MNCYILIGGRSRRMGRPKEELFLDRVASAAAEVFERVIAVQRNGGAAASIETIYESPHDDQAPVFGVARALEHARERCFILAVDYPLITAAILRYLRAAIRILIRAPARAHLERQNADALRRLRSRAPAAHRAAHRRKAIRSARTCIRIGSGDSGRG